MYSYMHRLDSQGHVRHRDFVWKVMEVVVKGNTTGMLLTKYSKVQSLKQNISANIFSGCFAEPDIPL